MSISDSKLRVIHHNPRRERLVRLILLISVVLVGAVAYSVGTIHGGQSLKQNRNLQTRVQALQSTNSELQQQLAIAQSGSAIDRAAVKHVRLQVKQLEDEKAQLHKELTFFKNVLAPEDKSLGIRVAAFNLQATAQPGGYRLQLVISQVAHTNPFLKGTLAVSLLGEQDGKAISIPLSLLVGEEQLKSQLGFRYFQSLPSDRDYLDFVLPDGFQPAEVKVVVKITSGKKQNFEQVFQWDQELVTDVR